LREGDFICEAVAETGSLVGIDLVSIPSKELTTCFLRISNCFVVYRSKSIHQFWHMKLVRVGDRKKLSERDAVWYDAL